MISAIPFEVPLKYVAGLADGSILRFGTILKDAGTGRILAHVQETGVAQQLLGNFGGSLFSPLTSLGTLGSSLYANAQLSQLKQLVHTLQALQFASLGVAVAGIGVSAIGFTLMNKKLNGIQAQLSALPQEIKMHFKAIEERELRVHYARIHGFFEQAEQARSLTRPEPEWQRIAGQLADESAFFRSELNYSTGQPTFDFDLFSYLVRSLSLCNAARIECLVLANELPAARKVAADTASHYNAAFDALSPMDLAKKALGSDAGIDRASLHRLRREHTKMQASVQAIREMQDASATKPLLLDELIERGIDGRQYLDQIRHEKTEPLLLFPIS